MPGKLPPSAPYRGCPALPKGSVSFGKSPTAAPSGTFRSTPASGQTPPTEGKMVSQRKQQAGM